MGPIKKKLAVIIILFIELLLFCHPADAKASESSLKTARNRIASPDDRKKAIDQLKEISDSEVTKNLLEILCDSTEPVLLRTHALETLLHGNDPWLDIEFKKILSDSSISAESRQFALYGLWKLNPDAIQNELLRLAQSTTESKELRADAINYLGLSTVEQWPANFWINLYGQKINPTPVRIATLNTMEKLGFSSELQTAARTLMQDSLEADHLRKSAILMGSRLLPPFEFEAALVSLISKPENAMEIKRFALDQLSAMKLDSASLLSLMQILSHERSEPLAQELKEVLSQYKELSERAAPVSIRPTQVGENS